ncbi:MAG: alpha/beta hydrolase [Chitinophagaceae bacterium]|nr:alpha/beta hydrolase [Chitinophagaceae bacterium]
MKFTRLFALGYIRAKFKILSAISKKKAAEEAFQLFCTPPTKDVKELPLIFTEAEQIHFTFHQYDIAGYRWNKGGHRKVLILHGFESTVINFEKYIQPFVSKGYEVLAFDAPAHGRSSGKQVTALTYRDLIKYIHTAYGPVHSYMGHSFGGFALSLALAEMPHDNNFRAAYIAPSSETSTAITNFFQLLSLDGKVRKEFEHIIEALSGHTVPWFSVRRTMPDVKAEILWLHDEEDMITPLSDALKVKSENHPNVHFVITRGLGHSRIYRDTEVIKRVVDFL